MKVHKIYTDFVELFAKDGVRLIRMSQVRDIDIRSNGSIVIRTATLMQERDWHIEGGPKTDELLQRLVGQGFSAQASMELAAKAAASVGASDSVLVSLSGGKCNCGCGCQMKLDPGVTGWCGQCECGRHLARTNVGGGDA